MATYSLSEKAVSDLEDIYEYTILNFGLEQARAYLLGLHERFQILADNPGVGRSAEQLALELRRHEYQSHIIFYVPKGMVSSTVAVKCLPPTKPLSQSYWSLSRATVTRTCGSSRARGRLSG